MMSVKPGLGNGKAPHCTWHEHHGGRAVTLVSFGRIYLQNNDQMRQHSWMAVTRGMESTLPGNEQWHSCVGQLIMTENVTQPWQEEGQELIGDIYL